MSLQLVRPTLLDLISLCARARPDEIEQYEALVGQPWRVDDVAAGHHARIGIKFALVDESGDAVCAAGFDPVIPGVWNGWMVGTMDGWAQHWRAITLHTNAVCRQLLANGSARRLEITALASRKKTCEWYERGLKMRQEGVKAAFGAGGEDAVLYARTQGQDNGRK